MGMRVIEQGPFSPLLQLADIEIRRGEAPLLSGVNLTLAEGEALFIAGRNGSGKSTLLRTICGLERPERGEILWQGRPVSSGDEGFLRELLYIGHRNGLRDALTAVENLTLFLGLAGRSGENAILYDALDRFGLLELAERPVRMLSQGQGRRVALCRLLLPPRRRVWVLDEPYTSLDAPTMTLLDSLIAAHLQQGGAVLVASHHQHDVGYPCRSLQLEQGLPG